MREALDTRVPWQKLNNDYNHHSAHPDWILRQLSTEQAWTSLGPISTKWTGLQATALCNDIPRPAWLSTHRVSPTLPRPCPLPWRRSWRDGRAQEKRGNSGRFDLGVEREIFTGSSNSFEARPESKMRGPTLWEASSVGPIYSQPIAGVDGGQSGGVRLDVTARLTQVEVEMGYFFWGARGSC